MKTGTIKNTAIKSPFKYPFFTLSTLPAPIFWAVKEETPFPSVINAVITILLSLIAAAYAAITTAPKLLITAWIKILPTETNSCWSVDGIAILKIFKNRLNKLFY